MTGLPGRLVIGIENLSTRETRLAMAAVSHFHRGSRMPRRAVLGLSLSLLTFGCVSTDPRTGAPLATPDPAKVDPAALKAAERVQVLGQRVIEQNTFTGIAPLFHTLGVPDPVLFHRGPEELFISEG